MIRMLVITSDEPLRGSIVDHFTSVDGFQVWGADSVDEGLRILDQEGVINVLVTEVGNAALDGTHLVLQFRRRMPSLPCIALASTEDDETREFLENQGLLRYRELPAENEDLDRLVNELLDEARSLGFQGHLQRISLIDVIQLYCATGKTGRLDILHWGKRGAIYFATGRLLHAVQGELEGQEAFYRLVGWDSGTFRVEFGVLPSIDTLSHESLHALLIEAIRRQDEARAQNGSDAPARVETRVETPVRSRDRTTASATPSLELLDTESTPERRVPVLKAQLVNDLLAIEGVDGIVVVSRSGVVLQVEDIDESEETLGTLTTFLGSSCESAQRNLSAQRFKTALIVERSQRKLLVVNTRNFYVGVLASAHAAVDTITQDVVDCIRWAAAGTGSRHGRGGHRQPALTPADLSGETDPAADEDADA